MICRDDIHKHPLKWGVNRESKNNASLKVTTKAPRKKWRVSQQERKYSLPSINFQVDIRSFSGEYIQKRFGICIINPSNACFFHVQTTLVGYLSLQTPFRVFQTPGQEGHPMDLGLCRSKADGRLSSALVLWRCAVPRVSHQLPGPSRLRRSELFIWKRIWGEQMTFWKGVVFGVFFGNQRGWGK